VEAKQEMIPQAEATLKYARISSRKVKIVADLIKGKDVNEALAILKYTPKASSEILEKLLKSAIANAENNHNMAHEKLYVADIYANQGPTLKRIRPAAKGSAFRIRKRTSHITIKLRERD
jgi:large subunit ribosomal protein L22